MAEVQYRITFDGAFYKIVEDDEASIMFLEGVPISAACVEHGSHSDIKKCMHECPHVEKLMKKIFS